MINIKNLRQRIPVWDKQEINIIDWFDVEDLSLQSIFLGIIKKMIEDVQINDSIENLIVEVKKETNELTGGFLYYFSIIRNGEEIRKLLFSYDKIKKTNWEDEIITISLLK
jgi:hypothetical protein